MSREKLEQPATAKSASILPNYLTEEEKKMNEDYEWAINDPEVRRQYGNQVVAVYQRRIWGAGPNHRVALEMALGQPDAPPRYYFALPVVPPLVPSPSDFSESGS